MIWYKGPTQTNTQRLNHANINKSNELQQNYCSSDRLHCGLLFEFIQIQA